MSSNSTIVSTGGIKISRMDHFCYLRSIIHHEGEIEEDRLDRIKMGLLNWRGTFSILCDLKYH